MPTPDVNRALRESESQSLQIHHHVVALHLHRQRLRHVRSLHHARAGLDIERTGLDRIGRGARTFCDALHCVPRKGSELGADVPEAAYVGLPLLREFERRRDMADEYAGCH
jgi:hypothetical protein